MIIISCLRIDVIHGICEDYRVPGTIGTPCLSPYSRGFSENSTFKHHLLLGSTSCLRGRHFGAGDTGINDFRSLHWLLPFSQLLPIYSNSKNVADKKKDN